MTTNSSHRDLVFAEQIPQSGEALDADEHRWETEIEDLKFEISDFRFEITQTAKAATARENGSRQVGQGRMWNCHPQ
jgi:hypothetical protein